MSSAASLDSSSQPRRRRSDSSAAQQRSVLTFTPTSLPSSDNGVQNITRKVIKRLEGLGHLEMVNVDVEEENESEVPSSNVSDGDQTEVENGNEANGLSKKIQKQKVDWEIPRKLLHSSIGFFTLYLYISESDVSKVTLVLWSSLCIIIPADVLRLNSKRFEKVYESVLGFLMRESEKSSTNGVIWYIIGVGTALQFYPKDIATVAILILSWADTAASTIGRLYGPSSPRLPSHLPLIPFSSSSILPNSLKRLLRIPLAPRKSSAGFIAASITGTLIAIGFWTWIAPLRYGGRELSWTWDEGVNVAFGLGNNSVVQGMSEGKGMLNGWVGLSVIGVVAGLVSGIAEAMDLGSLDDNLTLPIISGGCLFGFLKLVGWFGSVFGNTSS